MLSRTLPLLTVLWMTIPTTAADERSASDDPLQPLAYLVGGTWTAEGELPGVGHYTAERTYRRILGRRFIEQRHVMTFPDGQMETKGIIGWDSEQQAIVAWGFGNDGGIARTRADIVDDDAVRFTGERVGPFNPGPVRATHRRTGPDQFHEIAESKQGDTWRPMFTFRFSRSP